jgi:hypothetical protein
VSKRAGRAFTGYVDAQRRGLLGQATRQRERSAEHRYDTKDAMHALRIAHQGEEFLRTGRITLPVAEPERAALMQVRRGEICGTGGERPQGIRNRAPRPLLGVDQSDSLPDVRWSVSAKSDRSDFVVRNGRRISVRRGAKSLGALNLPFALWEEPRTNPL